MNEFVVEPEIKELAKNGNRARRFVMQVPLRYRVTGEKSWRRGETDNISSSGVLFRGDHLVTLNALVEMSLAMPGLSSDGVVEMVCRGVIVRVVSHADGPLRVAARILHCRWIRP